MPLIPIYAVQTLRLSDSVVSVGSALFFVGMGLSATLLFRMSVLWGHRLVLAGAALLYLCYPLMNAVARGPLMYYAAHLVGGGVWGVLNAALLAARRRELETLPATLRAHPADAEAIAPKLASLAPAGARSELVRARCRPAGTIAGAWLGDAGKSISQLAQQTTVYACSG